METPKSVETSKPVKTPKPVETPTLTKAQRRAKADFERKEKKIQDELDAEEAQRDVNQWAIRPVAHG